MKKMTLYQMKEDFLGKPCKPCSTGFYSRTAFDILKALETFAKGAFTSRNGQLLWRLYHSNGSALASDGGQRLETVNYNVRSERSSDFFASVANSIIVDPRGEICIEPCVGLPSSIDVTSWLKSCLEELSGFIKAHEGVSLDETIVMKVQKILNGVYREVGSGLNTAFFPFDYKLKISDIDEMVSFLDGGSCSQSLIGAPNDPILAGKHETWKREVESVKHTILNSIMPANYDSFDEFMEKLKEADATTHEKIEKIMAADCFIESVAERKSAFYEIVDIVDIRLHW